MTRETDILFMRRALSLAENAAFSARPNPHVGCVLVRDDRVIGEGYTCPPGGNHAEIQALEAAGDARDATAYVTLEPCSHSGLTGPCADALIASGISRIVIAMEDPNPLVSGKGLARIRAAGVEVITGVLSQEAEALIAGYVSRMQIGRGRVRAKLAMSLDGRTAMPSGESKWITNEAAREDVQLLRAQSCAIVTGIGSVIKDDSQLTVRLRDGKAKYDKGILETLSHPLRVLLDSQLRAPSRSRIFSLDAPTLVMHCKEQEHESALPKHVEQQSIDSDKCGLDLRQALDVLTNRGCNEILIESGAQLVGSFLREGLLDELIIYMAPILLGSEAVPLIQFSINKMSEHIPLKIIDHANLEGNFRFIAVPNGSARG